MAFNEVFRPDMKSTGTPSDRHGSDIDLDLGFGKFVSSKSRRRLLNRDGTFNVRRTGLGLFESVSLYHFLLEISWPRFFGLAALSYVLANAVFAAAYVALGREALNGLETTSALAAFSEAFFFSVYPFSTIGYGDVTPVSWQADVVVTLESLAGLASFGLAAGLMFARFARPNARIIFSRNAVIAPYKGGKSFEFRIVNSRKNQIIELTARVILARRTREGGERSLPRALLGAREGGHFPTLLDDRASDRRLQSDGRLVARGATGLRSRISRAPEGLRRNVRPDGARPILIPGRRTGVRSAVCQHVRTRRA